MAKTRFTPFSWVQALSTFSFSLFSLHLGHSRRVRIFFQGAQTVCPSSQRNSNSVSKFFIGFRYARPPYCSSSSLMDSMVILGHYSTTLTPNIFSFDICFLNSFLSFQKPPPLSSPIPSTDWNLVKNLRLELRPNAFAQIVRLFPI